MHRPVLRSTAETALTPLRLCPACRSAVMLTAMRHVLERRHIDGYVPRTSCPPRGDNMSPDLQRTERPRSLLSTTPTTNTLKSATCWSAVMLTAICRGHPVRQGDNMSPDHQRTERPRSLLSTTPTTNTVRSATCWSAVMLTAMCREHPVRQGTPHTDHHTHPRPYACPQAIHHRR
jgi:hypothetical protein